MPTSPWSMRMAPASASTGSPSAAILATSASWTLANSGRRRRSSITGWSTLCDGMLASPGGAWRRQPIPAGDHFGGVDRPVPQHGPRRRGRVDHGGRGGVERPAVDHEVRVRRQRRGRLGRGRRASARRAGWRWWRRSARRARRRPARARGRAPAARWCASGSPRWRSTPGPAGQHQRERPRPEPRRPPGRRPATGSASVERLLGVDAHSTASGTSARRPFSANTPLDRVARRRQRGQPVDGVRRQHDHAPALAAPPRSRRPGGRATRRRYRRHSSRAGIVRRATQVAAVSGGRRGRGRGRRGRARRGVGEAGVAGRGRATAAPWVSPISTTRVPVGVSQLGGAGDDHLDGLEPGRARRRGRRAAPSRRPRAAAGRRRRRRAGC